MPEMPEMQTNGHARVVHDPIDCHDPATRRLLGQIPVDGPEEVARKVALARRAQPSLQRASLRQRARLLAALRDRVVDDAESLVEQVVRDAGKSHQHALVGEIWPVCEKLRWTEKQGPRHLKTEKVSSGMLVHKKARLEFHPLGVVGAILPWNYPLQNIFNPLVPALMAGNAVVIKPSEWVAWSSAGFVSLIREVLQEQGFDPELVQVVQGYGETGAALIASGIDTLVFIGSVPNGRRVLQTAADKLVPVVLELGGKDPLIVCEDAHLEQAVHAAVGGCFVNCGQNCVASERILLHESVYADFEARAGALARALRQGPSQRDQVVDVGAMNTPLQLQRVENLVQRAVAEGARLVAGGARLASAQGEFFAPTVLADVTPEMEIMREETFGPVMLLCRVKDDEEAIAIANGTEFGLSCSVFSKDRKRARDIVARLNSGMAAINDFGGLTYMAQDLTFGGVKASGYGRMNGREGLRSLCNVKAVLDDRLPLHLPTPLFPVKDGEFETVGGVIDLRYGRGLSRRLRGLGKLLGRRGGKA